MANLRWFLKAMKQPQWVNRAEDDYDKPQYEEEEERIDSVVPPGGTVESGAPAPASSPALDPQAVESMATQMWGEGFGNDVLEDPNATSNPLSQTRFPMGKKLQYGMKMRKKTQDAGLEPQQDMLGGTYGTGIY